MNRSTVVCIALILSTIPLALRAELMIGGYPTAEPMEHPIRQFPATAQGSDPSIREISGPSTLMNSPAYISYEPQEDLIYVSDFFGQAIRVYPRQASGDSAPLRVLNPPLLGQPRTSLPMPAQDELVVIAYNCCLYTFPLHAEGAAVDRVRSIEWGGAPDGVTELNNPVALIWLPDTDELAVVDFDVGTWAAKVVFHDRTANGYPTPTRVLKGPHTANAAGLAHDPSTHRLFLLTQTTSDNVEYQAQIRVFDDSATGDDAPLYSIEGPMTELGFSAGQNPSGLALDLPLHRLMVGISANGNPADNRVVSFDLDATGDATPVQVLSGTTLSTGSIGTPAAVPFAPVHANGFEN